MWLHTDSCIKFQTSYIEKKQVANQSKKASQKLKDQQLLDEKTMDEARYKLFKQHLADWLKEDQDKIKLKDIDLVSFLLCN